MFRIDEPAVFYNDGHVDHRVWLRRKLTNNGPFKPIVFALHNPSTAGKIKNDPTANKGIVFATAWGGTDLIFVNASTQIATKATDLDPNYLNCLWSDWALLEAARLVREHNGRFIVAWGAPKGKAQTCRQMAARYKEITNELLPGLITPEHLRKSPHGWPEHPLYLPYSLEPKPWVS